MKKKEKKKEKEKKGKADKLCILFFRKFNNNMIQGVVILIASGIFSGIGYSIGAELYQYGKDLLQTAKIQKQEKEAK